MYPAAGHVVTGNLKIISDSRIRYIVSKGPKYRFPSRIDLKKCREEIASALNDFGNRWCKPEYVEPDALKEWKVSIFKIVDQRIKFYSQNTNLLPPKPKSVTGNLKIISDSRIRYIVSKGPKYRFPSRIDLKKCREEIASALNDFGNRWCKPEYVEPDALKEWKVSIFKIVDQRIKFYSQNTNLLPPKPKSTFRHLKQGIQDFHRKYVLS